MAVNLSAPLPEDLLLVEGVKLGIAESGIRKSGRKDLLLMTLAEGARVSGVFTQNRFCAAPVQVAKQHLASGRSPRALLVNTGNANAGTGKTGITGARASCEEAARLIGCDRRQVLPFSTGVILEPLLAFVATDAPVAQGALRQLLADAAARSFNRISVDGDTSTNDSFVLIATGAGGGSMIDNPGHPGFAALREAVLEVSQGLAQAIVRDGEGATKFITVRVEKGRDEAECASVAYAIAHSPLVKTAFFASDPNLGRLLAAIGNAGVRDLEVGRVELYLDELLVSKDGGRAPAYREEDGKRVMEKSEITVRVVLNRGTAATTVWTCDLSHDYVTINAEYRT